MGGYLAIILEFERSLPAVAGTDYGADFVTLQGTTDPSQESSPTHYPCGFRPRIRSTTRARAQLCATARRSRGRANVKVACELMYQSHESYSRVVLLRKTLTGCKARARSRPAEGLYGAKIRAAAVAVRSRTRPSNAGPRSTGCREVRTRDGHRHISSPALLMQCGVRSFEVEAA